MKKICDSIKNQILKPRNAVTPPVREIMYDGDFLPIKSMVSLKALAF